MVSEQLETSRMQLGQSDPPVRRQWREKGQICD